MGNNKQTTNKTHSMKVAIAIIALIAIQCVQTQALGTKVNCCKTTGSMNVVPTLGNCPSSRRLARRMQAIVPTNKEFTVENCENASSRRLEEVVIRRNQALTYKCPVSVNGWRCYTNDARVTCKNNIQY